MKCSGCGKEFKGPLSYSTYFDLVMPDNEHEPKEVFCSYECSQKKQLKKGPFQQTIPTPQFCEDSDKEASG